MLIEGIHDYRLVVLSVVLSICGAYGTLEMTSVISASRGWRRVFWLSCGATAIGAGTFAMHFTGMLLFSFPAPALRHYYSLLPSILIAISASAIGLFTASRESVPLRSTITASIVVGSALAAMHYIAMEAIIAPTGAEYHWSVITLSLLVSIGTSFATLFLAFRQRDERSGSLRKLISALILGSAISLTHIEEFAIRFRSLDTAFAAAQPAHLTSVALVIARLSILLLMLLVLISAFLDRDRMQTALARASLQGEASFRTLAEAIPQIFWIGNSHGHTTYLNKRWYEMTGSTEGEGLGVGWIEWVHPDDRAPCLEKWQKCMLSGETYEIEYRLRDSTNGYRWYLGRAVPLRDEEGVIQQWFGTCTDIEEQKHYQQVLEQQIKERTEELADTNTRLQQEMWEKDLARRTLDEHNEEMMQTLKERSQRATLLAKMGELLQSCHTREEVFTAALGFAPKIFPSRRGAVALFNPSHNLVEVAGQWHDCRLPVTSFEAESCWALRTGHPHLVLAGDTTARCGHVAGVESAYLCIPILAQGEALGILHIQATDQDPNLGEAEMSFKTTFADQVGLSVANIRLRDALRAQSTKDPLTGLYNRRYLQEMLDREIRRAIRSEQSLGILMLDLDHFKNFNDTYGHDAGDAVLRETGSFIMRSIRVEDFVCRYGGEEFVVVLPTADLPAAEARAQRIRTKLRDLVILHAGRSFGLITASIGVAALPDHGTNEKDLLQAADAALYRAKREGRDRVAVAEASGGVEAQANYLGTATPKT
jgi:diguanylate cyclase (GGDEF)-like protein/PAS domain S-box-containing protein